MERNRREIEKVTGLLRNDKSEKSAFLGFDACIDYIAKIVREKQEGNITRYFSTTTQLGEFLNGLQDKSAGIELMTKLSKPGGNMVITANALGNLGVEVECAGTFGFPEMEPVFHKISPNCHLHTIGDTITATALEFDNSKIIMFDPGPYRDLKWSDIKNVLGIERIVQLLSGKKLIAFLNWSEIENSTQIWEGFLEEVFPYISIREERGYFFTDLSDCSRRSKEEIIEAMSLIGKIGAHFRTFISLNSNEADLVAKAFDLQDYSNDEDFVIALYESTQANVVLLHRTDDAIAFDGSTYLASPVFHCEEPAILTGGGDNFNAGFCFSLFLNAGLSESLLIANAVAGYYVCHGTSPRKEELISFLEA